MVVLVVILPDFQLTNINNCCYRWKFKKSRQTGYTRVHKTELFPGRDLNPHPPASAQWTPWLEPATSGVCAVDTVPTAVQSLEYTRRGLRFSTHRPSARISVTNTRTVWRRPSGCALGSWTCGWGICPATEDKGCGRSGCDETWGAGHTWSPPTLPSLSWEEKSNKEEVNKTGVFFFINKTG